MICHQIRFHDDDSFSYWLKKTKQKKKQDIFCSRIWAWIFRVKRTKRGKSRLAGKMRTYRTYYPLYSHLDTCCAVFTFLVKQVVPSDEDLEWLYPSCLLYKK